MFAWIDPEQGQLFQRKPPAQLFDVVAAERPKGRGAQRVTPDGLIVPAGWGMAALFSCGLVPGGIRAWVPVEAWKRKLFGSFWNARKDVFCRNICQEFGLTLDPDNARQQDEIDAIGIMHAAGRFTRRELMQWEVKW